MLIGNRSKPVRYAKAALTRFGSVLRGTDAPLRTPLMAAPLRDSSLRATPLRSETRGRSAPRFAQMSKTVVKNQLEKDSAPFLTACQGVSSVIVIVRWKLVSK